MQRRELLRGAAIGSVSAMAAGLLAPRLAAAQPEPADSEAARALAELQAAIDQLEAGFADASWQLRTPQDFAEGRRVLLHALLHGVETWLEADPARPFFRQFIHQHKKLLGDNPDARYYSAAIDDQHRYLVRGNLAGATYTSFTIELENNPGGDQGLGATLNDTQFSADANGDFEITVSRDKVPGNWLPLPAGAASITSRHYYEQRLSINNNRLHHVPLDIQAIGPSVPRPSPNDADIAAGIRRVTAFVQANVVKFDASNSPPWVSRVPNRFEPPTLDTGNQAISYAAKDNVYAMAPFVLMPDQALLIRGRFPQCRFSNLVLFNRFLQTLDYETRTISLNRAQTVQDKDGRFEMTVAHRDPGRPNWLDTEGRTFGIMFWRFQLPEEDIEPLETEVITLA